MASQSDINDLRELIFDQIQKLGSKAHAVHQELMKWREPPLESPEKTKLSVEHQSALETQQRWVFGLQTLLDIWESKD